MTISNNNVRLDIQQYTQKGKCPWGNAMMYFALYFVVARQGQVGRVGYGSSPSRPGGLSRVGAKSAGWVIKSAGRVIVNQSGWVISLVMGGWFLNNDKIETAN